MQGEGPASRRPECEKEGAFSLLGDGFSFPSAADGATTAAFTGGCRRLKRTGRCWDEELRAEGRAQVFGN